MRISETVHSNTRARIGMVNFINTAPLYETWNTTAQKEEWQVTEAAPTVLNRLIYENKLDLGFISSHEYAAHPNLYKILSDLSISSSGPVGSVFLFSTKKPEELSNGLVLLSDQSQTSVSLVQIILEEFYKIRPRYASGVYLDYAEEEVPAALLAIGDEALRLKDQGVFPFSIDLGEIWHQFTGLPFVFALWAVREDFCAQDPDAVVEIHQELLRCVWEGKNNLAAICEKVAPRIPISVEKCCNYLQGIEYDLGGEKQRGLRRFFEYLIQRGEADATALPLKICG